MNPSPEDLRHLRYALAIARGAIGLSDPNPRVGCVLVAADGRSVIGHGHTQEVGGPHAEAMALQVARSGPQTAQALRGATAYVTLEPCAHHGRTPPCAGALAQAGIARVVVIGIDPNPLVAGQGMAMLRSAGVEICVLPAGEDATGRLHAEARDLNIGFFSRMLRQRPWVRMKIATSIDGRTALSNGKSQWITSEAARHDGHAWRKRAGAVLTGVGTVREDDPRLDVRFVPTARQPLRVVVDSRLETPPSARLLDAPGVLFYAALPDPQRREALEARGVEVAVAAGAQAKVDLPAMLADLAAREVNELHIEAGHKLNGSLLREDLVDELLIYIAPTMLGAGREMAAFGPLTSLADGLGFEFTDLQRIGPDLRIVARRNRALPF